MKTKKWMLFIFSFLLVLAFFASAQEKTINQKVYSEVDEMPVFKGGQEALMKFLQDNIVYPEEAKKSGFQGKVFISFVIDELGVVRESRIARGVNPDLDKEALRVVKLLPEWVPGKKEGKPVKVEMTLPIKFALDDDKKTEKN
jgi:periplasmic protein TonB